MFTSRFFCKLCSQYHSYEKHLPNGGGTDPVNPRMKLLGPNRSCGMRLMQTKLVCLAGSLKTLELMSLYPPSRVPSENLRSH